MVCLSQIWGLESSLLCRRKIPRVRYKNASRTVQLRIHVFIDYIVFAHGLNRFILYACDDYNVHVPAHLNDDDDKQRAEGQSAPARFPRSHFRSPF